MGGKPLGQLEIDEHAAEAGIVTRLEAFVDTIRGFARSAKHTELLSREDIYRGTSIVIKDSKSTFLLPRMSAHVDVIGAMMEVCGARVIVLPEPDERNLLYSNQVTTGIECLRSCQKVCKCQAMASTSSRLVSVSSFLFWKPNSR